MLYFLQKLDPLLGGNGEVQETLYHVELADESGALLCQVCAQILRRSLGSLLACLEQREHHKSQFALKLGACLLQLYHLLGHLCTIEVLHTAQCGCYNLFLYAHFECIYFAYKLSYLATSLYLIDGGCYGEVAVEVYS